MDQDKLFCDDIYDACGEVIRAAGGFKKVAGKLRPEKTLQAAETWLRDCLNRDRRERLDPEQIAYLRRLGREIGCHAIANYEAADAGYQQPVPLDSETYAKTLVEHIAALAAAQQSNMERLNAILKQNPSILNAQVRP